MKLNSQENNIGNLLQVVSIFLNDYVEKAKVDNFGFHAIRHLTATQLYRQSENISKIQTFSRRPVQTLLSGI